MPPKEISRGELKARGGFELAGGPRPGVEEIPSPAVRREQQRVGALPVRVAVESRVGQRHAEECAGRKAVYVREACGSAFAVVVRRSGLGNQRGDVGELRSLREYVQRHRHDLLRRNDRLQRAVRIESLLLDFVARPGQPAHRIPDNIVFKDFGESYFIAEQRTAKDDARRGPRNADEVVVLPAKADIEVPHAELPTFWRRHGFHDRQPTGEPSVFGGVRSLVDADRLHRIEGNRYRKRTCDWLRHFGVIHYEHGLIFACPAEIQFSFRRADDPGSQRQRRFEVLFGEGQSIELFFAELRSGGIGGSREWLNLRLHLDFLRDLGQLY